MKTTGFSNITEDTNEILTGKERYPVIGNLLLQEEADLIMGRLKGMNRFWDCLFKNYTAQVLLRLKRFGAIQVAGSLMIMSKDLLSSYGYYFNPPLEFHSWLRCDNGMIIDLALPGVIEKGLITSDKDGPYIIGRKPIILAGKPKNWMKYKEEIILT
jgi:hypothetical protein